MKTQSLMTSGGFKHEREEFINPKGEKFRRKEHQQPSYAFLETIDEKKLDFDFEKRCSVTLSYLNCYCCLVCGKYLQGRHESSPAFLHSVNDNHHVFISFNSLKVFLLPDNIEVKDQGKIQTLVRVRNAIRPYFNKEEILSFPIQCFDLYDQIYTNGFVGFNNSSSGNESINVVLSLLSHIIPVRNYFLLENTDQEDEMIKRLAIIVRKIWFTKLFKPYLSSEEFLAYISVAEKAIFDRAYDPGQLFIWLVNTLANKSPRLKEILNSVCQGVVQVTTIPIKAIVDIKGDFVEFQKKPEKQKENIVPYWCLALDLPPNPLFKTNQYANDLPQVRLEDLLKKFNGTQEQEFARGLRRYRLIRLPKYLIIHFSRFDKKHTQPVKNRNQTLVEFSQSLELQNTTYTLIANVIHETAREAAVDEDEKSRWKIQLLNSATDQWIELDGTTARIKERELLFLQETYLQLWRKDSN